MAILNSIESLEKAALQLEPDARLKLTRTLVDSFSRLSRKEIDQLWLNEAERRDAELESGKVAGISGVEVFKRIRARFA